MTELTLSNKNSRLFFFNRTLLGYIFVSFMLSCVFANRVNATELTIADNLLVRDIDDEAVEHGFLSKKRSVNLSQGKHTLVIKYKDVFEDLDLVEDVLVKSDYFVVKFLVENQKQLILSTPEISDLAAAEHFAKEPEITLLDEGGKGLVLELEKLSDYELAKQVTKVVTTLSIPVGKDNANGLVTNTGNNEQIFTDKVINDVDVVPMLKYWWQKADTDEKEKFLLFINENNKDD